MKKILVVGDIITDKNIFVTTERKCQEKESLPIYDVYEEKLYPGGAANVMRNIQKLTAIDECEVFISGITDYAWNGWNTFAFVKGDPIEKHRYYHGNDLVFRADINKKHKERHLEEFERRFFSEDLSSFDIIVVSDYDKGTISESIARKIIEESKLVIVDSKRKDLSIYKGASFLNINHEEYSIQVSQKKYIVGELFGKIIVTMGEKGAKLVMTERPSEQAYITHSETFTTERVEAVDVTGCGDTHTAAFAVGLMRDELDERNAIRFANRCATIAVTKLGTYGVSKWDFLKSLEE